MKISQKIIDYAIWYYLRYYPSPARLSYKLKQKFGPDSLKAKKYGGISDSEIDFIVEEKLKNIIQQEEVIKAKIKYYMQKGKSKLYIKQKLFERREDKTLAEKYLQDFFKTGEKELIKKEYEKQKAKLQNKLEGYELKRKITERLLQKGFAYDEIVESIDL